jgi:FAD:protein FMN transferase
MLQMETPQSLNSQVQHVRRCKPLLGTFVEVSLNGTCERQVLLEYSEKIFCVINSLQERLSFHSEMSELSVFNRWALTNAGTSSVFSLSLDLRNILSLALDLYACSEGLYDICVAPLLVADRQLPEHLESIVCAEGGSRDIQLTEDGVRVSRSLCIDLGGIAKGYAIDQAMALVPEGVSAVINAGGDLAMNDWQGQSVSLRYGRRSGALRQADMLNAAVATSGNYHRRGKFGIINPLIGKPVKRGGSVSVFAASAMLADALTKVVWLSSTSLSKHLLDHYQASAISINRFGFKHVF